MSKDFQKSKFAIQEEEDEEEEDEINKEKNSKHELPEDKKSSSVPFPSNAFVMPPSKPSKIVSISNVLPIPVPKKNEYLEWDSCFDKKEFILSNVALYSAGTKGPVLICLHGAGHSALSFGMLSKELKAKYQIFSFDFRGHGDTKIEKEYDLMVDTLIQDAIEVISEIYKKCPKNSFLIVGHSMGGSIATKVTKKILENDKNYPFSRNIKGMVIIDVVEGTAMEALPFMEDIVSSRPKSFPSIESAIKWNFSSGTIKNKESARVSTKPLLKATEKNGKIVYEWRTDLMASKIYWEGWFKGLTEDFLSVKIPKVLILAGSERMDKPLIIANMQGKFRLEVVLNVGHVIQEDNPKKVASIITNFIETFQIFELSDAKKIVIHADGHQVIIGE